MRIFVIDNKFYYSKECVIHICYCLTLLWLCSYDFKYFVYNYSGDYYWDYIYLDIKKEKLKERLKEKKII